jgi:hypothetical protein
MIWVLMGLILILIVLIYFHYNTYENFVSDNRKSLYDDYKRKMGYVLSYEVKPFSD